MNDNENIALGIRLRTAREQHGLSQRALARRAGVGNGTISAIESGVANPSVGALKKILDGIPLEMAEFFSFEVPDQEASFYKAEDLQEIGKGAISYKLVGAGRRDKKMEMLLETYAPGSDSGRVMLSHEGEECGILVTGQLEVTVGAERRLLSKGDAFYFDSRTPHRFRNPSKEHECVVISSCTPPSF